MADRQGFSAPSARFFGGSGGATGALARFSVPGEPQDGPGAGDGLSFRHERIFSPPGLDMGGFLPIADRPDAISLWCQNRR